MTRSLMTGNPDLLIKPAKLDLDTGSRSCLYTTITPERRALLLRIASRMTPEAQARMRAVMV